MKKIFFLICIVTLMSAASCKDDVSVAPVNSEVLLISRDSLYSDFIIRKDTLVYTESMSKIKKIRVQFEKMEFSNNHGGIVINVRANNNLVHTEGVSYGYDSVSANWSSVIDIPSSYVDYEAMFRIDFLFGYGGYIKVIKPKIYRLL